ncbi:helix-turn-helix domain-containing protein [Nitrospirillum pindoramense]|uniref:Helix-turn-helix protein n=1 Tax=Nitrospirillum amazonense TaxID=28077 RepID=A0A560HDN9_9PROT|nr:helix-turn-helix transcriptional regulator [Nitrospirillum amazonense]TWB44516.1 helix-turn-helix protein [Nitrospirillum amazonense]
MPRRTKNTVVAELEGKIEGHVASRIRLRRGLLGMSQSDLARALGITFQQVQKYERGSNRVSVGKLYRLAEILDVPLTFFFDDLEGGADRPAPTTFSAPDEGSPLLSRRDLDLLRAWRNAPADIADCVAGLLRAVSQEEDGAASAAPSASGTDDEAGDEPKPTRRRRGAVWDPADMYKAAKAPKRGKSAPTPP